VTTTTTEVTAVAAQPDPRVELLAAALAYAARGWHVFPLRPGDKRPAFPDHAEDRCTGRDPRCRAVGRHLGWEQRATTDEARIRTAWTRAPFGIGIACGPSRLLVIDLDTAKPGTTRPAEWDRPGCLDGADVLAVLAERAGQPVPWDTYTATTPSGGTHLYFTAPAGAELRNTAGTIGWLVDTRGRGGYVAAPPTRLPAGAYAVTDPAADVAELPAWLAELLAPRPAPAAGPVAVPLAGHDDRRREAYLRSAVQRQLAYVTAAPEGRRNHALLEAAVALGQLVAGGELDRDATTAALMSAGAVAGQTEAEATRTIASGFRRGATRPRTLTAARQHAATDTRSAA
jgi:hypothetical protein